MSHPEIFEIDDPNLNTQNDMFIQQEEKEDTESDLPLDDVKKVPFFTFLSVLFSLIIAFLSLVISLWVHNIYQEAQKLHPWLGWLILGLSLIIAALLLLLAFREVYSLFKFNSIKKIRKQTAQALENNQRILALKVTQHIYHLYKNRAQATSIQKKLQTECNDQLDNKAILTLTEEYWLHPLDKKAQKIIQQAGHQVAISTALSRILFLDVIIIFFSSWRMVRSLAELYGMRPSRLGLWRLFSQIFMHMIVTGGMAAGEDLLGSLLGQGMAAKLSARLGEGVVNGLMSCRIGLVALEHCRPMPYLKSQKPSLKDIAKTFLPKIIK